mgnify:CR=1 FL=1
MSFLYEPQGSGAGRAMIDLSSFKHTRVYFAGGLGSYLFPVGALTSGHAIPPAAKAIDWPSLR